MGHIGLVRIIVHFADPLLHKMLPYSQRISVRYVRRAPTRSCLTKLWRVQAPEAALAAVQSSHLVQFIGQRRTPPGLNPLVSMTFGCSRIVPL